MKKLTLDLPAMYGDHHVIEVRRILLGLPGVEDVYASSSFHIAEISYDAKQIGEKQIAEALDAAGYTGDLALPQESGQAVAGKTGNGNGHAFRHSASLQGVGNTVSFAQNAKWSGRGLWPCPGIGPLKPMDE